MDTNCKWSFSCGAKRICYIAPPVLASFSSHAYVYFFSAIRIGKRIFWRSDIHCTSREVMRRRPLWEPSGSKFFDCVSWGVGQFEGILQLLVVSWLLLPNNVWVVSFVSIFESSILAHCIEKFSLHRKVVVLQKWIAICRRNTVATSLFQPPQASFSHSTQLDILVSFLF